ncbi:hypothetical protein L873DRAFT_724974 [Choiromyces venosus 120613-1]|uniref:Uncharacterized protein n=1 Tax=Choiromyces venosus 120613-1 TaxID=1336337 RepID=A0A3N4JS40_9PEZI|nr:hypothetical protein L873DRAFT_724974 [Choiromyces venosus 120613-1]
MSSTILEHFRAWLPLCQSNRLKAEGVCLPLIVVHRPGWLKHLSSAALEVAKQVMPQNHNISGNTGCFNVFNVWDNGIHGEKRELLGWLSPFDPRTRHQDIQIKRVANVGDWLLKTGEFKHWYDLTQNKSNNMTLFCYGGPGIGKTYISSLVTDTLGDQASGRYIVTSFYFDFATQKEQSAIYTLGALLKQVVSGLNEIPEKIIKDFRDQRKIMGGRRPRLDEIVEMLQTVSSLQRTFICIDALDECAAVDRQVVLDSLRQILEKSPNTRLFLTGRSHIRDEIQERLGQSVQFMNIKTSRGDIIRFLLARLSQDTNKVAMTAVLKTDILKMIPDTISEILLLASLTIEAILQEPTICDRRSRLKAMTDGLADTYGGMLERIKAQGGGKARLGMAALMWICHSERPFQLDDLRHALAVKVGSPDLDYDNVPSMQTLLDCCQGLLSVDEKASTVRLFHITLQQYLSTNPNLFSRPHSRIAETCLSYLNSRQVKALSANPSADLLNTPFLRYCSVYWGTHAKRELSDDAKLLALDLFGDYNGHISAKLLLEHVLNPDRFNKIKEFSSFTGLHCASFFGIVEVVAVLIQMNCDVNQIDCVGKTPLTWAVKNGHDGVAELLQQRKDVIPDIPCISGHTPPPHATNRKRKRVEALPPPESIAPKPPQRPKIAET